MNYHKKSEQNVSELISANIRKQSLHRRTLKELLHIVFDSFILSFPVQRHEFHFEDYTICMITGEF